MRILIFNELYTPYTKGGAEISTQLLAESLSKLGHDVHVCTSSDYECEENINSVNVHRKIQHNIYWSYWHDNPPKIQKLCWHLKDAYNIDNNQDITKLFEDVNPDIIHTNVINGFSVIIWKIANKKRIPVVHTLRDYYLMCVRSSMFKNGYKCTSLCTLCKLMSIPKKLASKYVDGVVGISQFILNRHLDNGYFRNAKIHDVIPNAVSLPFDVNNTNRGKVIGFLGRVYPNKGIEFLIREFLKSNNSKYVLKIAGDGKRMYFEDLKNKYECDKIQFLGRVDATAFLRSIELLVVPSLWDEPFGRVIVEANACGCPVFVSNRGGMPELINDNNGRVFSLENQDSLCQLLNNYYEGNLSFKISSYDSKYSSEKIAKNYISVYGKLL